MQFVMSILKGYSARSSLRLLVLLGLCVLSVSAYAESPGLLAEPGTFAEVASNVISVFEIITKAIVGAAYVAGVGFAVGAIMKFKQHKDNPTQIPIGTPIAMLFIATSLVALPTIIEYTKGTLFGTATTDKATPRGYEFWKDSGTK